VLIRICCGMELFDLIVPPLATAAAIGTYAGSLLDARNWPEQGTGSLSHIPYAMLLINASSWLVYGAVSGILSILVSNGVGLLLSIILSGAFIKYCRNSAQAATIQLHFALVLVYVVALSLVAYMGFVSEQTLGVLSSGVAILMFASPLATLQTVLATRSSESLPAPMVWMGVTCTFLWTLLGLRLWNLFMLVPNGVALVLGVAQVALLLVYPSKRNILP
jgi:solute carrier family 50 protein (sugar transporter)